MIQDKEQVIADAKILQKSIVRMLINCMNLRDTDLLPESLNPEFEDIEKFEQGSRERNIYQIGFRLHNLVVEFQQLDDLLDRIIEDKY